MKPTTHGQLLSSGIFTPDSQDWRVRVVFTDGSEQVIRVSPGRISIEEAVKRAKRHLHLFDETVVKDIEAHRVARSTNIARTGIITK
jgi:hypothetical protein